MRSLARIAALAAGLAAAASLALSLSPSSAQAATCGAYQPFLPWGDWYTYIPMVNGGLESGSSAWTLTGTAAVVSGNEPSYVGGSADSHSLSLPSGSSATVHASCLGMAYPVFRFLAQNTGASTSSLRVDVTYSDLYGSSHRETLGYQTAGGSWKLSPQYILLDPSSLAATQTNGQIWLSFTPIGTGGSWRIDDVYIDPYKMR